MPHKGPHISLAPERLVKRVLGLPLEEFQTWPEYLQQLALRLAEELFIIRYNPFIPAKTVRDSVKAQLQASRTALSPAYFRELSSCLNHFWESYEADEKFKGTLISRLSSILSKDQIVSEANNLIECSTDATDLRMELPALVVFPENIRQIQAIIRLANEMGFPIVPRGGGSGMTGGAVPAKARSVVLSLSRLKEIIDIDTENRTLTLQAGVITLAAIEAAAKKGLLFTVDPASKAASSIGGNISENAGGPFAFEYGTTLDNLLSYKMILPTGELIEVRRVDHPRHKILPDETVVFEVLNESGTVREEIRLKGDEIRGEGLGKDVTNKFLGGLPGVQKEGVDGIIAEATFTAYPLLPHSRVMCLEFYGNSMRNAMHVIRDIVTLRDEIRNEGDLVKLSALEEFGIKYVQAINYSKKSKKFDGIPMSVLIIQLDSEDEEAVFSAVRRIVDICDAYDNVDSFVAADDAEAEHFWHDRHQLSAIAKRTSGFKLNEDIVIPLDVIPEFSDFLEEQNLYYLAIAYREALQQVQQLAGVDVDDEFVLMEMGVATAVITGKTSKDDLPEQEFQLQTFFFFQHLKSKYPKHAEDLTRIFEDMQNSRLIIASHMHAGDGNCHVNLPVNSNDPRMLALAEEAVEKVFARVLELKGQISGEHGIGITKIGYLDEEKISALRTYKAKIDPNNIFNPGKLTQRDLVVVPYTFSFNRLIKDINKTALPSKENLIDLLLNVQTCTRCGKCKQVCPMYLPQKGLLFHPRNKNITLGALVEAIYYSQLQRGEPDPKLLNELQKILEHCTTCGKCYAICPVKIKTQDVTLQTRAYLEEKGAGGHPFKNRILHLLTQDPQTTLPRVAKLAGIGQEMGNVAVNLLPERWRRRLDSPLLRGKGPSTQFTNLKESLHLAKGNIFTLSSTKNKRAVIYFPGCGAGLFYRSIGLAGVRLLLDAGVNVVLPPDHLCCGYPLLASGYGDKAAAIAEQNQKALSRLIRQTEEAGFVIKAVLTACGTCREGIREYKLKSLETKEVEFLDVVQFIMQQDQAFPKGPEHLLYHAACHHEWPGVPPLKAADIYARELERLTAGSVKISPYCCGESGLGAMTSPKIYNRLRQRKKEQLSRDLEGYTEGPVVVGCPSCKIGVRRTLMEMDTEREVLHTLEFLAELRHGSNWMEKFSILLDKAAVTDQVQVLQAL
jgi:FAD/FMN-containing dehydrogenase/Fe-S oxidoreductase